MNQILISLINKFRFGLYFRKLVIISTFLLTTSVPAEIVRLRDGKTITGRVTEQNISHIQLKTEKESLWIPKNDIIKIQYVPVTAEQKKQQLELARKKQIELQQQRARIEKEKMDRTSKELELKKLDEQLLAEKSSLAKEQSARAAALRELVDKGQMEKPKDEPISYWDFAWRSILVPGWGHFTIDRPLMGTFYLVAVTALLANTYNSGMVALNAEKENHRQAELNYYLYLQPQLAPFEMRFAYASYSNALALTAYQQKVDNFNHSLYALELFYGIQLLHIIYNGIAWENGLLIVEGKKDTAPVAGTIRTEFMVLPDAGINSARTQGGRGNMARFGMTYYF